MNDARIGDRRDTGQNLIPKFRFSFKLDNNKYCNETIFKKKSMKSILQGFALSG